MNICCSVTGHSLCISFPEKGPFDVIFVFSVLWTPLVTLGRSPSPRYGHSLTAVTAVRIVLYGGWDGTYLSDMHLLDCQDGVSESLYCYQLS